MLTIGSTLRALEADLGVAKDRVNEFVDPSSVATRDLSRVFLWVPLRRVPDRMSTAEE